MKQIVPISYTSVKYAVSGLNPDVKKVPNVSFCTQLQKKCPNALRALGAHEKIVWKTRARLHIQLNRVVVPIRMPVSVRLAIAVRTNTFMSKAPHRN